MHGRALTIQKASASPRSKSKGGEGIKSRGETKEDSESHTDEEGIVLGVLLDKSGLLHYLCLMSERGQLHRIVVDECHVVLTDMEYRAPALQRYKRRWTSTVNYYLTDMEYRALALQRYKCLMDFNCQLLLLTATLPPTEEPDFLDTMGLTPERQCQVMRYPTCRSNLQFRVLGIPQPRKRGQLMPEKCEILGPPLMDPLREGATLGPANPTD